MDLRTMLNDPNGDASKNQQPPPPSHQHPPPSSSSTSATPTPTSATPATPVHAGLPPQSFRDYPHPMHASPVPHTLEYSSPTAPPLSSSAHPGSAAALYSSPTSYNPPANAFAGRPPVPPLQPPGPHDIRSPRSASISGPSSYRHTPTSSASTASGGYPFPPTQPPVSPVQRHQYGPPSAGTGTGSYSRDSFAVQHPPSGAPVAPSRNPVSYVQGQPPAQPPPQTPPVGTPGGGHQYPPHQRSLSIQSTPTPTSAHSQPGSYGPPPYSQGSPIATTHSQVSQVDHLQLHLQLQHQHQRQSSQPPTPLGPPIPVPARQSPALSYQQPPSPYQKRTTPYPPHPTQTSPPPPAPASIPRLSSSSSHGPYDTVTESHRRSRSRSGRERSVSVSPKTRVPSLPSSTGHRPLSSGGDADPHHSQHSIPQAPIAISTMEPQRASIPSKRKLDQDEAENEQRVPPPPQLNGNHMVPRQKRVKHDSPPVWAQSGRRRPLVTSRNFSLRHHSRQPNAGGLVNGNSRHDGSGAPRSEHASRHTSPEATRSVGSVKPEEPSHASTKELPTFNGQPFPWEPSIGNEIPKNIVSREVADFLGMNVLQFPQFAEVQSRGVQFEIEARLGIIIDKMTNDRINMPSIRAGECVLGPNARVQFRSSMTESQHCELNGFLNEQVRASFPRNPTAISRVQVQYVHRREVDRFFELPSQMRQRIPVCVSGLLQQSSPLKARVTYDQKTGKILAKIIKARIGNLNIHFPHLPLDCRIGINLEWDWDGPAEEIELNQIPNKERPPDRIKDRLSYAHGLYQIDLTQVTQGHPTKGNQGPLPQAGTTKEHELEIELEARSLIEHGRLLIEDKPNRYEDLVDGLVNNVRLLARRCPEPHI
ncbi:mRNA triphosphatase CET1 [Durotheca rogersii]|uniref:mRNA triphosphatase CET1 n=1 Tax=Durotheca rogersii TaxID=419775 RepID=UPI002220FB2D|nr:mRNA triphosphatase CET1 [Durotheca rogersii]KAI5857403.1 mRNA triphosphatase CET1 [Durotheca rogersii]